MHQMSVGQMGAQLWGLYISDLVIIRRDVNFRLEERHGLSANTNSAVLLKFCVQLRDHGLQGSQIMYHNVRQ
jgi:hypothetical protein